MPPSAAKSVKASKSSSGTKRLLQTSGSTATPSAKRPRTSNASASKSKSNLKFKSPAEFFAENKNIAGFDNPGKSLYTTIRELVENALDAAEAVNTLPDVSVSIQRIDRSAFQSLVGIDDRGRVDHSLYKDVENEKERRLREAREKREAKRKSATRPTSTIAPSSLGDNAPLGDALPSQVSSSSHQPASAPSTDAGPLASAGTGVSDGAANIATDKRRSGNEIFRVCVTDNGSGMPHDDVPNMMGRVLAGTKYCVRQARGKFGLGSKMALIWAKMSTGLPIEVSTAMNASTTVTRCVLDIDIANNVPTVVKHERARNDRGWRGSHVVVTIEGNWTTYRSKIVQYMRQMAVITPYAKFNLKFDSGGGVDDSRNLQMVFARRTDIMPPLAQEVKHHPSSVNQLILKQIIDNLPPSTSLLRLLSQHFESIPRKLAVRLITELGPDFTSHMRVADLELNHIRQIDALLHQARFDKPDGKCLSPAGEYNLRLGIMKELRPTLVATHAETADVFEGHPFVVEAGVALGGAGMKAGINIFRFANRIPLLFEAGNDVVTKTAREDIRWNNYKISPVTDRIGVICSIVSTKIPFKGTGKEYIGDDADAIKASVKRAITQCCLQLKAKLLRRLAQKDAAERKRNIAKYAPDVANAIVGVFREVEDGEEEEEDRKEEAERVAEVCKKVKGGVWTKDMFVRKLVEHVQKMDKEQAIEYAAATGRDQKTMECLFVAPRSKHEDYIHLAMGEGTEKKTAGQSLTLSVPSLRMALCKRLASRL